MKTVYAHFPINIAISDEGKKVDIRNFLGEKYTRVITMPEGVTCLSSGQKDEYQVDGNDIDLVSQAGRSAVHLATATQQPPAQFAVSFESNNVWLLEPTEECEASIFRGFQFE